MSARPGERSSGTILIVDDERTLARAVRAFLQEAGYEAEVAGDAEQALGLLESLRPDVVFSDVRLPGMSGIELLRRIREFDPALPVVIMTAYGTIEGAVEAVKLGAFDYLKKPVDLEELKLLADRAREHSQMRQELSYYRRRAAREVPFAEVIGESPGLRAVLDQARQIAALDETPPVLISGETGTGKGLVARTIHASSPRAARPFIEVNCTALPATLMEAELFGHERGAFTGADRTRIGAFEAAAGGTLFLDEIGELESDLQPKLLRAVESRTFRRVGSTTSIPVDVRVVAATCRDLRAEVNAGRFRPDLYYRLAVLPVRIPSLRERLGDLPLLVDRLLDAIGADAGAAARLRTATFLNRLARHGWPGNVRELRNHLERCLVLSESEPFASSSVTATSDPLGVDPARSLKVSREAWTQAFERRYLEALLTAHGGNVRAAAVAADVDRTYLYRLLWRHGLK